MEKRQKKMMSRSQITSSKGIDQTLDLDKFLNRQQGLKFSFIREQQHKDSTKITGIYNDKLIFNLDKKKMNKSQIFTKRAHNLFNHSNSLNNNKIGKSKENIKMFDNNHVPSFFLKNKPQSKNQQIHQEKGLPLQNNTNLRNANRQISRFRSQLQTTYQEEEEQKESQHIIEEQPQVVIVKKKTILKQDTNFMQFLPKLSQFDIGQMLGKGAYGTVKVARHKQTGYFFALKNYSLKKVKQNEDRFVQTVRLQMFAQHPNIAQLYSIFRQDDQIYLLMELCIDGDLSGNLKSIKNKKDEIKRTIKGIVGGLSYLNQKQIIHRDIKLENILICHGMAKITDFDLSIYQKNPLQSRRTFCGSPAYFSPQMLTKYEYNSKVDIWSLGILCYEIICGYYPFQISSSDVMNIVNKQYKQFPLDLCQKTKHFIKIMLAKDPEKRATWPQIISHPYFQN